MKTPSVCPDYFILEMIPGTNHVVKSCETEEIKEKTKRESYSLELLVIQEERYPKANGTGADLKRVQPF